MSQAEKGALWRELQERGVTLPKHYREYSTQQLRDAKAKLDAAQAPKPKPAPEPEIVFPPAPAPVQEPVYAAVPAPTPVPVQGASEHAGMTPSSHDPEAPIRIDPETGFEWYVDEVPKAALPRPRGRRLVRFENSDVKTVTINQGSGRTESFEMPGERKYMSEARVTLPSHQVGIYKDPRYPFKIHVYNNERGFDLFEVEDFYNGVDLMPKEIKRKYVGQTLCYDMRTTIRAIEDEYRERALKGEISK